MPQQDGWAVLEAVKSDADLKDIPVIVVSVSDDESLGFTLGASEFITKPVDRQRLIEVIHELRWEKQSCQVPSSKTTTICTPC
ncbi:MAG: response regulator [Myxococcota bacterium]